MILYELPRGMMACKILITDSRGKAKSVRSVNRQDLLKNLNLMALSITFVTGLKIGYMEGSRRL